MVIQGIREFSFFAGRCRPEEAAAISPLVLAYVGDAVYELIVGTSLLDRPMPVDLMHRQCVEVGFGQRVRRWSGKRVKTHLQADEAEIARRAATQSRQRRRTASVASYRRATALEARHRLPLPYRAGRSGFRACSGAASERLRAEELGREG